ncbi:MAG TPA: hypothetical protein VFQ26_00610 [Nitrospiraceae bacterium]|nr:hypothetical protein [Nitrospiraceae bacterium]
MSSLRHWTVFVLSLAIASPALATPPEETAGIEEPIMITRRVYLNESLPVLGARLYSEVDYPLRLQQLDAAIELADAELKIQRERAAIYDRLIWDSTGFIVTIRETQLAAKEAALRLSLLRNERILLLRTRADQARYRQLLLEQGSTRLMINQEPGVRYDQQIR